MRDNQYQAKIINDLIARMNGNLEAINAWQEHLTLSDSENEINEKIKISEQNFNSDFRDLVLLVIAFLEKNDYRFYLRIYFKNFHRLITNQDENYVISINSEEETYYASPKFSELLMFLKPFHHFDRDLSNKPGIIYLENILKNTPVILKDLNITPNKESDVYDGVRFVVTNTFVDHAKKFKIYGKAKNYIPDILLPSLNCAIEYKYAEDVEKLANTIDEILIDVQGYSNDPIYNTFYAVFYTKNSFCSEDRFMEIWKSKNFPENWKPIIVFGH